MFIRVFGIFFACDDGSHHKNAHDAQGKNPYASILIYLAYIYMKQLNSLMALLRVDFVCMYTQSLCAQGLILLGNIFFPNSYDLNICSFFKHYSLEATCAVRFILFHMRKCVIYKKSIDS